MTRPTDDNVTWHKVAEFDDLEEGRARTVTRRSAEPGAESLRGTGQPLGRGGGGRGARTPLAPPGRERPEPEAATAPKAAAVGQTGASALGGASLKRSRHSAQSLASIAAPARRPPRGTSVLGAGQFVAQLRDADDGNRPDLVHVHAVVVVSQQMAKVHDVAPRHLRVTRLEVVRDRVRRFADDLEQSLRSPLPCPVAVKRATARYKFGDLSRSFELCQRLADRRIGSNRDGLLTNMDVTILQLANGHYVHRRPRRLFQRFLKVHQIKQ